MASLKACAKKKPFQKLLLAQLEVFHFPNSLPFAPVVDGYFMPGMCYFKISEVKTYTIWFQCLYFGFRSKENLFSMICDLYYVFRPH